MTQVSRKGFVDKNGQKVVIVPNIPGATAGNLPKFDAEGNLQDSGIDAGLVGKTKFLYRLGIVKSGGAYTWDTNTTQALLEEVYNALDSNHYDAIPVRVNIGISGGGGFSYAGFISKGEIIGVKRFDVFVGDIAFQVYYNSSTSLWGAPIYISAAVLLDALKSSESISSGNDSRLITSGAVKAAINEINEKIDNMHALEYEDETYLSCMGVGKLNRDDDELDGASVYGKDAIRIRVNGGTVYIDGNNINNLQRALDGDVAIKLGSIYIVRNDSGTSFPIASKNDVKAGLESFINNHQEGVTFIEGIRVVDLFRGKSFNPAASISWARRQMTPTTLDVVVFIGGTKQLTATATVPEDSLDTITWDSEWDFKDYSSSLSIESNS